MLSLLLMKAVNLKEKIINLEVELALIKKAVRQKPDFNVDEKIWHEVEPIVRKIRKRLY